MNRKKKVKMMKMNGKRRAAALLIALAALAATSGCGAGNGPDVSGVTGDGSLPPDTTATTTSSPEDTAGTSAPPETSAETSAETSEPQGPRRVADTEEIKDVLRAAILELRQPEEMIIDGVEFGEQPELDVRNLYYALTAEAPELKYAYDLSVAFEGETLLCRISYMPYKTGDFPEGFDGISVSSLAELAAVAEENLGAEPVAVRLEDPSLEPDDMSRALRQAGGGYILCELNADATEIRFSPAAGMSIEECLSALEEVDTLADRIVAECVNDGMTEREKAEALYSYVTEHVEYDQRYYTDQAAMPVASTTALGALRDNTAICGGYAHAVDILFEKVGIDCFTVSGKLFEENHMWNVAQLDGQWLYFDATADRGLTGEFGFLRFGLTEQELLAKNYIWEADTVAILLQ